MSRIITPEEREKLERKYTTQRIVELRLRPIKGNYDAAHLKEIHRYIFQDLPKVGLTHIPPGVFRSESERWYKYREPSLLKTGYYVFYSTMDSSSRKSLDNALTQFKPDVFKRFNAEEFPRKLGEAYARLDYIHPFYEGNSRTLREFTFQFSNECGRRVNWELFSLSHAGRSHLYIARDRPVIEMAIRDTKEPQLRAQLIIAAERLKCFKPLSELLKECVHVKKPVLVLYAGSNQSGKSTLAAMNEHAPQKFHEVNSVLAIEEKKDIVVEASLTPDTLKLMSQAKSSGYEVHLHFAHTNHAAEGLNRVIVSRTGRDSSEKDKLEFIRDANENYRNLENAIALSDRAMIYDCSGKNPVLTQEFSKGKLISGGEYQVPVGIRECTLAENIKKHGSSFLASLSPDMEQKLSMPGMKYRM